MNFRLARPAMLIDLNPLRELDYVRADGDGGAAHRRADPPSHARARSDSSPRTRRSSPRRCRHVAHPQIRNRGTLGGNLAHADPASELPAVMLALGARLRARSARGERWIEAAEFFRGLLDDGARARRDAGGDRAPRAAAAQRELLPRGRAAARRLRAARRRRGGDARRRRHVHRGASSRCATPAPTPVRAARAAAALVGRRPGEREIGDAAAAVCARDRPAGERARDRGVPAPSGRGADAPGAGRPRSGGQGASDERRTGHW